MNDFSFPVFKTKAPEGSPRFRLEDPAERRKYFDLKAGSEIGKLRAYLKEHTFISVLLGKKNSGKGTYSKLFAEAVGPDFTRHISVGDIVRSVQRAFVEGDEKKKADITAFLDRRYRGFVPYEEGIKSLLGWSVTTLLPSELILTLVEYEISLSPGKALFIDGFPRDLDQISYALFLRAIMGYREDPDFFVFIDVPEVVIDERLKYRVICPACQTPRNVKLLRTKEVGYDEATGEFYLKCDNPNCASPDTRMVAKAGDSMGIEPIRQRLELDEKIMRALLDLQGVPKVYLRNAVPVNMASEYVDDYELTPAYRYERDAATDEINVIEEPWIINDSRGTPSYSLMPPAVAVSLIKQTAGALGL